MIALETGSLAAPGQERHGHAIVDEALSALKAVSLRNPPQLELELEYGLVAIGDRAALGQALSGGCGLTSTRGIAAVASASRVVSGANTERYLAGSRRIEGAW